MRQNNVLQFRNTSYNLLRTTKNKFNWYAPLFYISLSFNILFALLMVAAKI